MVSYEELENGELKLFVEAVWIKEKTDCAIASELVVKLLDDGTVYIESCGRNGRDRGVKRGKCGRKCELENRARAVVYATAYR